MNDYTNGEPFIVTHREPLGERSIAVRFLLPDGRRHYVILDTAVHSEEIENKIGNAFVEGRINLTAENR